MKLIQREELKELLDGEDCCVVMVMSRQHYSLAHIPGSQAVEDWVASHPNPDQEENIVVYCTNELSHASFQAFRKLESLGFAKIYRYAGGLEDWEEAGYPLEGSLFEE